MAYLATYRKYRPRTFVDIIGQEHITTTLKNQIKAGQISSCLFVLRYSRNRQIYGKSVLPRR